MPCRSERDDNSATSSVKVVSGGDKAHAIMRADLARFLVDQMQSDNPLGQALAVANT